jgi:hypothetical protein
MLVAGFYASNFDMYFPRNQPLYDYDIALVSLAFNIFSLLEGQYQMTIFEGNLLKHVVWI